MPITLPPALLLPLLLLQPATAPSQASQADRLAADVMAASGAPVWTKVTRLRFTFNVERGGKPATQVKHDWDVRGGTDTVTWNGKTVTVNLLRQDHDGEEKQAYARFINDSYWLLAPLKVMDGGVIRSTGPPEVIDGRRYELLHLAFENVGLTPTDRYNLWIDPETRLVRYWDYIPANGQPRRFTWEDYRDFSGLKLSTRHQSDGAIISFSDIEVVTE